MRRLLATLALLVAATVFAHDAPIPPGDAVFESISIEAAGARADAGAAAPGDTFRVLFDTSGSIAQLQTVAVPARALAGALTGSLTFRSLFQARLLANGVLVADGVPLALVLDAGSADVRVTLTTGVVALGESAVEGSALAADGRFTLVGVTANDQLVGGAPLVLRLGGRLTPSPDIDGFALAPVTKRVTAKLAGSSVRVRALVEVPVGVVTDFATRPALVRLSSGDATVGAVVMSAGLVAAGKRFAGDAAGGSIAVRTVRKKPITMVAMDVEVPAAAASAGAPLDVSYDVGGLIGHGSTTLRGGR
jgi:hypothetical protein